MSSPSSSDPAKADKPLATLAHRIVGLSNNLLASGLVLLLLATIGWQTLRMWRAAAPPPQLNRPLPDLIEPSFFAGDKNIPIQRDGVTGTIETATQALITSCSQVELAESRIEDLRNQPPKESESAFLASLDRRQPALRLPNGIEVFTVVGPIPMAVAVYSGLAGSNVPPSDATEPNPTVGAASNDSNSPSSLRRIPVCWAFAVPLKQTNFVDPMALPDKQHWSVVTIPLAAPGLPEKLPFKLPSNLTPALTAEMSPGSWLVSLRGSSPLSAVQKDLSGNLVGSGFIERQVFRNSKSEYSGFWQKGKTSLSFVLVETPEGIQGLARINDEESD